MTGSRAPGGARRRRRAGERAAGAASLQDRRLRAGARDMVVGECPAARLDVVRAALLGGAGPAAVGELLDDLSSDELLGAILQPGRTLAALCAPGTFSAEQLVALESAGGATAPEGGVSGAEFDDNEAELALALALSASAPAEPAADHVGAAYDEEAQLALALALSAVPANDAALPHRTSSVEADIAVLIALCHDRELAQDIYRECGGSLARARALLSGAPGRDDAVDLSEAQIASARPPR